jgi:hypothetical protein
MKGGGMKFVISYTTRPGGSAAENVASAEAAQKLLTGWTPSPSATIHQWVQRCDGQGGFTVLDSDNGVEILRDLSVWNPWLEFQVFPVVDLNEEATAATQDALNTARGVI